MTTTTTPFRDRVPGSVGFLGSIRAQAWERFAAMAVAALREAAIILHAKGLPFDHEHEGYWGDGKYRVLGAGVKVPLENGITDSLVRALQIVRTNAPMDHPISELQVYFVQQQPRETQKKVGSKAYTTDIQIRSLKVEYLDLRVEAKVLFDASDVTAYCGNEGLLRFAHPEPYTDQHVGMMLGYSVRHDDAHWLNRIEAKAMPFQPVKPFADVVLDNDVVRTSTTASHATGEVLVIHLMLPFETAPSARALDLAKNSRPYPPKPHTST